MRARNPVTKEWMFFVDKCLPFGASISCALFQRFLDALKHLNEYQSKTNKDDITNYLDDFLFIAVTLCRCNQLIDNFLKLCDKIGVPIAVEKTEWATLQIIFLGILLDGKNLTLAEPLDKKVKTINLLTGKIERKKATV